MTPKSFLFCPRIFYQKMFSCLFCLFFAGLVGLTRSLAKEVASKGVRVNLVAPGLIATDMTSVMREKNSAFSESIPMQRYGDPSEVAEAVRFLVESPYLTGQVCEDL